MYKCFIALVTFICRYLVLSDAIENGTGFYIVRHGFSLLWYRNSTDFCVFILRPANLLSVFVVTTSRFMVDSFLYIQLCYLWYSFTSSFLIWMPLYTIFSVYLLWPDILNSSGENGHVERNGFCSYPTGKASSLSTLIMLLSVVFS